MRWTTRCGTTRGWTARRWATRLRCMGALLASVATLFVLAARPARAQPAAFARSVGVEGPREMPASSSEPAAGEAADLEATLRHLRLQHARGKRRDGWALFAWGLASTLAGGLAAAIRHDDEAWVAAGLTSAGFGLADAALALPLMDLSGARRRGIEEPLEVSFERARDDAAAAQLRSGQTFALNLGLDVFYMATGALMAVIGRREDPDRSWLVGSGAAFVLQGAFLFAFDIAGWVRSNRRARALFELGR